MSRAVSSEKGLQRLAEVVRQARNGRSYRDFEALSGISHATLRRIEHCEVKSPDVATLNKLSPFTAFSPAELLAVAENKARPDTVREYRLAEDVFPIAQELPQKEKARLAQMLVGDIGGLQWTPPDCG